MTNIFGTSQEMPVSRREMLTRCGIGFGGLMLQQLLNQSAQAGSDLNPLLPKAPHFAGRAKYVIHIFANGGPSHVDTWDYKPSLKSTKAKICPVALRERNAPRAN